MADQRLPITGACMCGAVRLEASKPLLVAFFCHCTRCQRRSGTGVSVNARTVPGTFSVVAGQDLVGSWDPGDGGWIKSFCGRCGSQVFSTSAEDPGQVSLRMGVIDGDPGVRPSAHQFTDYAPVWAPVPDDGLPRFPERISDAATPPGAAS